MVFFDEPQFGCDERMMNIVWVYGLVCPPVVTSLTEWFGLPVRAFKGRIFPTFPLKILKNAAKKKDILVG